MSWPKRVMVHSSINSLRRRNMMPESGGIIIKASYWNTAGYLASAVIVSTGTEKEIGKFTNLRIEPYLQIPLGGTAVVAVPVKSAGLHFFIARHQ